MSSLRPFLSAHDFQTFIHVLVVLTVFLFTAFSASFSISSQEISGTLPPFFLKTNFIQCCHGNLVIPSIFAVMPLLRGKSNTINQSKLRNFSAYIIMNVIVGGLAYLVNMAVHPKRLI